MGTAATKAKRKWNSEHYTNITAAMAPELANQLKADCKAKGVSVTSVITELVAGYLDSGIPAQKEIPSKKIPNNRSRRKRELLVHIAAIEDICNGEEMYLNRIPTNLQDSIRYENAESSVEHLQNAIAELKEVYPKKGR